MVNSDPGPFTLHSCAKINLGLEVVGRRPDGYHLLRTLFQTIDLWDEIHLTPRDDGKLMLAGDHPGVHWDDTNTIAAVFRELDRRFGMPHGFDIRVHKRIPPGAGLGGGSGNAAVCMLFFANYFGLRMEPRIWVELAARVGADIPFFLAGGTVEASGIGDQLTLLDDLPGSGMIVALPEIQVPTARIYRAFRLTSAQGKSKISIFLETGQMTVLDNQLEPVTFRLFPEIKAIKEGMLASGCDFAAMSGSGAAVYGMPAPDARLDRRLRGIPVVRTRFVSRSEYEKRIGAWPSGKAPVFGAGIRRFESSRPSNS